MFAETKKVNDRADAIASHARPTLLIIDDDPRIAKGIERSLHGRARFLSSTDGYNGREIANARKDIDLIVLDLTMPHYDAIELLKDLHKDGVRLPIVLMSGWNADFLRTVSSLATALGFTVLDAVEKPFESVRLIDIVAHLGASQPEEHYA
jgi:DNA-binding NtrC family response regulator